MARKAAGPENLSMFDFMEDEKDTQIKKTAIGSRIDVVKMEFAGAETVEWTDLFAGFQEIHAITYSSGIDFIYHLLDMFEKAEIIFGCEAVMSYTLQEVMAYQGKLLEDLRNTAGNSKTKLIGRLQNESVCFYVARTKLSHEKIYLLKSDDGRKRVVTGSANMSFNAFGGRQRENICYIDGDTAYDWYMSCFERLKEDSTDRIEHSAFELADFEEHLDLLPISGTTKVRKGMMIEPVKEDADEVKFVLDTRSIAAKLAPFMPKADKKTGIIKISPETIVKVRRHIQDESVKERELRSEYPQLIINAEQSAVTLNGDIWNLNPSEEDIRSDVALFLKYMEGYRQFHGDVAGMQCRYFEFANWFFCSPFMAVMRDMASRFDQQRLPYPVFGLIYGQSKAGKTSFLETLLKMMIGQKPKISAPDFTRSSIEGLKHTVQGAPIIVDDLTQARFSQHAIETIKNDDFGVADHMQNYPAVVISANEDVKAVAPEVIRRTVICRVEAGLTNTEVMKSNTVRMVQQKIGTAFYREYLRRMLDVLPDLIEQLKDDESESAPDILKYSADVILAIFSEYSDIGLPEYIRPLTLDDYFGEQVTGKYAIKTIKNAWKIRQKSFIVNERTNELRYQAGTIHEAANLMKELPETLEAHKSGDWVVMNLSEARGFFEESFKKPFWNRKQ